MQEQISPASTRTPGRSIRVAFAAAALLLPIAAIAAPWDFGVALDVGVIRTDNIFLENEGFEEGDTVYTIAPEFSLTTDGDRIDADIRYRPEGYFFSGQEDADDVFHVVDASLTASLIRDRFFVYLGAVNFQSAISSDGIFPTTNLPLSGNRIDLRTIELRPYWQQRIGQANLLLEVAFLDADYDDELFQGNNERAGQFRLDNIQRQQGLSWGLDYSIRRLEYELSAPFEYQRAAGELGVWLNRGFRIFGVGGSESSFENLFESNLDENFWEAGFQYTPNQRLNLEIAYGDRSFGKSLRADFSYVLRRGDVSFTYSEEPTSRGELAFDRRPILDLDNLDGFLDDAGLSDRFLRRRGELGTTITLSRSALTLRVFSERRELRTTAEGVPLDDGDYAGAAVRWSWDLGSRTTFGVGGDYGERDQSDRNDKLLRGQLDLMYSFGQRTSLRVEVARARQDGELSTVFDYIENQYRLLLRTEFF